MTLLNLASFVQRTNPTNAVGLFVLALIISLVVALFSRHFRLPYTLILVIVGLIIGILPILTDVHLEPDAVLFLFMPALLFEGAINVHIRQLRADWLPIFFLAVPGLGISLALIAASLHWGIGLPWLLALLVGAMVSPTDPVAVIALLKQMHIPTRLTSLIEGESLFNDGVGSAAYEIVLGLLLPTLGISSAVSNSSLWGIIGETLWLVLAGPLLGASFGWLVVMLLKRVSDYDYLIQLTTTLSVAYGAYLLGDVLHTSGLLAVVGAGLVMGNYGKHATLQPREKATRDVWEFIGYLANSILFLLLGIQIGSGFHLSSFIGILLAILGVIMGRVVMVYIFAPLSDLIARRSSHGASEATIPLPSPQPIPLQWRPLIALVGLRGALSIALVLGLPANLTQKPLLEDMVYGVVFVTLLVQGLALRFLLPHWPGIKPAPSER